MVTAPDVVVFDVNETLTDMSPLADRFAEVGAPPALFRAWFAGLLRDGFALNLRGANPGFADVGQEVLREMLAGLDTLTRDLDAAVQHVMGGFGELALHPDVPDGLRILADGSVRMVTLTNGSTTLAEQVFARAGVTDRFERFLSVEDAGAWKPARQAYAYAAERCGSDLTSMLLVAVHPWDIDGAKRAGMRAAWLDRRGTPYPRHFTEPDVVGKTLDEVALAILDAHN